MTKKFFTRAEDLSRKAANLKAALQSAPAKIAAVRERIGATASQIGQLRADVQAAVGELRSEGELHLAEALQELDSHAEVFLDAGYQLSAVEMEIGVAHRLVVCLDKFADVSLPGLRQLLATQGAAKTVQAILSAIVKATEVAERANLTHLHYQRLTAYVGISPSIRICWTPPQPDEEPAIAVPSSPTPVSQSASPSAFVQSSFFEPRPPAVTPPPAPTTHPASLAPAVPTPIPATTPAPVADSPEPSDDPLARFKRMPNLAKYGRR